MSNHHKDGKYKSDRIPAKSIADFELDEKCYQPDFELTSRFEGFATELQRLALLGIGAYGFLISTVGLEKGQPSCFLVSLRSHPAPIVAGLSLFAVSAGCALASNFLSTKCLAYQLDIVRMYNRLHSARWNEHDQQTNLDFAARTQSRQKHWLEVNRVCLLLATIALIAGAIALAATFGSVLLTPIPTGCSAT